MWKNPNKLNDAWYTTWRPTTYTTVGLESIVPKPFQNGISHPQLSVEAVVHFPTHSSISFNLLCI